MVKNEKVDGILIKMVRRNRSSSFWGSTYYDFYYFSLALNGQSRVFDASIILHAHVFFKLLSAGLGEGSAAIDVTKVMGKQN